MSALRIIEKFFWHTFKIMPGEMILKKKWAAYYDIKSKYCGHTFDLSCVKLLKAPKLYEKTIWFFWNTGLETAPLVVRKCYESLMRNVPDGWQVKVLTEDEAHEYVQLPDFVERLKKEGKMWYALYADLIRLALLYHYGGIWCDATCYLTQPIPTYVTEAPLFMFSYESLLTTIPAKFENWFIKADRKNYVISKILENLLYYWSQPMKKQEYFCWFHIQSALYEQDEQARTLMNAIPYKFNYDAMLVHLHYGFDYPYSDIIWKRIKEHCFVQKLTYKYDKELEKKEGVLLSKILENESL